jgi:hypothetical protein
MRIIFPKFYAERKAKKKKKEWTTKPLVSHLLFAGHERLAVQLLVSSRRKMTSFESVSERGHDECVVGEKMSFFNMTRSREMVPFGRYFLMIFLRKKATLTLFLFSRRVL